VFGLTADEVARLRQPDAYDPRRYCEGHPGLAAVMDALRADRFCPDEPGLFRPLYDRLASAHDPYLHLADFAAYAAAQMRASLEFADPPTWARKAVLNVAGMGKFSSDRTITEYAKDIWGLASVPG
jgi:starch phosphorylase